MQAGSKWLVLSLSLGLSAPAAAVAQELAPQHYVDPSGDVVTYLEGPAPGESQFASAILAAPSEPLDLAGIQKALEKANARLDKMDAAAKKKKEDDEKKKKEDAKKEKKWYDKYSIRGYSQLRYNQLVHDDEPTTIPQYVGDSSIGQDQEFLLRRARVIISGNVSDHAAIYIQPDFATNLDPNAPSIQYTQLRDWYADLYVDKTKIHRFRVGQSKIPYGWENLQSSSNRLCLDRNDAFNSAARNERDLGVFYYWTPEREQELFKKLVDENLKGSGNYGVFGIGFYNGQGGSFSEANDQLHTIARFALPWEDENCQIWEVGIQGYAGKYVVTPGDFRRNGTTITAAQVTAANPTTVRGGAGQITGVNDTRLGWTFVKYPQPFGFQAEWTIGRGPALNQATSIIEERALYGGYVQAMAKIDTACHGVLFPFVRYQQFKGGYKNQTNSPYSNIHETSIGLEWQFRKEVELVTEYLITDRTNVNGNAANTLAGNSYRDFDGDVLRFQLQVNY